MTETADTAIDPVTFEVMRHRLWAINDEQGTMAARLSPSPVVNEAFDFNAALLTADGRGLYSGVYIVAHASTIDVFIRQVLERWDPAEIHEGDMFFTNDPWSGALHANDGILAAPIFWDGEIVCWAGVVMHDDDVGSPVPGSWVVGAENRFGEAPLMPPVKMVESFKLRPDLENAFARNHRTPQVTRLNLRARLAALSNTNQRIHELIERYGVRTFLACQERIIEHVEQVLRHRLEAMPDGRWTTQVYHDHDGRTGELYPVLCTLDKKGDELTVDFTGTARQVTGAVNCALPALEGAVFGTFLTVFCFDLPWSVGAVRRVVKIVSEPGTINNAVSPAGVSMASVAAMLTTSDAVMGVYGQLLMASGSMADEAQALWSPGATITVIGGMHQDGQPFTHMFMDGAAGGGGARSFTDGIDTGGGFSSMSFAIPNVETSEDRAPVLQLYRRESRDSCGHGRWRGGVGIEFAITPHKATGSITAVIVACGVSQPGGSGLSGGTPPSVKASTIYRSSDVRQRLADGSRIDCGLTSSTVDICQAKDFTMIDEGDVLVSLVCGGAGFGDPVRRAPELVARDVRDGLVSETIARGVYGVVLAGCDVDSEATSATRDAIRTARRKEGRSLEAGAAGGQIMQGGEVTNRLTDTIEVVHSDGMVALRCSECGHKLGSHDCDFKTQSVMRELSITVTSELNRTGDLHGVVLREYSCPGCGTAVAMDVQRRVDPLLPGPRLSWRPE